MAFRVYQVAPTAEETWKLMGVKFEVDLWSYVQNRQGKGSDLSYIETLNRYYLLLQAETKTWNDMATRFMHRCRTTRQTGFGFLGRVKRGIEDFSFYRAPY
ncbi:uncharacterized protein FTOL_12404 [Fusarium torulosum]|uniref:Uncharacterized protein n=1 Tax=Fusarium torulosum TaxID=33205 RepID=A0AAE8SPA9_9HYPO|nr:uncharacterized protein FTOL_12404 [Fusarium torulosum]